MLEVLAIFAACVGLMLISSDILVRSIIEFANKIDVPPHLVTLISVSLGSSLPEIMNSIIFAINGIPLVGLFTIFNNLVIDFTLVFGLGIVLAHSLRELYLNRQFIFSMIFVFVIFIIFILDKKVYSVEGLLLFVLYPAVFLYLINESKGKFKGRRLRQIKLSESVKYSLLIAASIFVLLVNANLIYIFARLLMKYCGVPDYMLGFILGFFTVTPEVFVTLVSHFSLKRTDIAIFNLLGSFVTDLTLGVGIAAAINPYTISTGIFVIYISVIILYISLAVSDLVVIRKKLPKEVGYLLMGAYLFYVASLFVK